MRVEFRLSRIRCEVAPGAGRPSIKAASNCCTTSSALPIAVRTVFTQAASASPPAKDRVRPTAARTCGLSLNTSNGKSMPRRSAAARASVLTWARSASLALAVAEPGPLPDALRTSSPTSSNASVATGAAPGAAAGAAAAPAGVTGWPEVAGVTVTPSSGTGARTGAAATGAAGAGARPVTRWTACFTGGIAACTVRCTTWPAPPPAPANATSAVSNRPPVPAWVASITAWVPAPAATAPGMVVARPAGVKASRPPMARGMSPTEKPGGMAYSC